MSHVEWDGSLSAGYEPVDGQHRTLVSLFNECEDVVRTGCDRARVENVLVRLSDYAATHFAEEEDLMRQSGYPDELVQPHVDEHRCLSVRTRELIRAHRVGRDAEDSLTGPLREWLTGHIDDADRALVRHLRSLGMTRSE